MLSLPASIRIYVAREAVDFRKAHDGLISIIRDQFGDDPFDGSLYLFLNRRKDRVKILQWDRDGFWLHYKRLEHGKFRIVLEGIRERVEIPRPELTMLLEGIDIEKKKIRKPFDVQPRMRNRGRRGDKAD